MLTHTYMYTFICSRRGNIHTLQVIHLKTPLLSPITTHLITCSHPPSHYYPPHHLFTPTLPSLPTSSLVHTHPHITTHFITCSYHPPITAHLITCSHPPSHHYPPHHLFTPTLPSQPTSSLVHTHPLVAPHLCLYNICVHVYLSLLYCIPLPPAS